MHFMKDRSRHCPETMPGNLCLGVVPHAPQCCVDRRLAYRSSIAASAGEYKLAMSCQCMEFAQDHHGLRCQWYKVNLRTYP